jgi:cell division protein FtsL
MAETPVACQVWAGAGREGAAMALMDLALASATGIALVLLGWAVLIAAGVVIWQWMARFTSNHLDEQESRRERI